jgi:hypothetical protein
MGSCKHRFAAIGHGIPRAMRMRVATLRHRSLRMFPHLLMLLTLMHIANAKYIVYLTGHVIMHAPLVRRHVVGKLK